MTATDLVQSLEECKAPLEARRLLSAEKGTSGLSAAFFARVAALLGANPGAARQLASHWKLVLEFGDDPAHAYRAKGASERMDALWMQSAASFARAGEVTADPVSKLAFQTGAVDSLARAGQVTAAVRLGRKLALGLDKLGETHLAARVRLNVGNALLWIDDYSGAQKWLSEAESGLRGSEFGSEHAMAIIGMSTVALYRSPLREAEKWAHEAVKVFSDLGLDYYRCLSAINLAHCEIRGGQPSSAMSQLLSLRDELSDSPADAARVLEFLGDSYLELCLYGEALDAYQQALKFYKPTAVSLNLGNIHLGLAESRQQLGLTDSHSSLKKALQIYDKLGNRPWSCIAQLKLAAFWRSQGQMRRAKAAALRAVSEARGLKSPYVLGQALLESAECNLSDAKLAGKYLREAEKISAKHGFSGTTWRIYALLAQLKKGAAANSLYQKMLDAILAQRAAVQSVEASRAVLRDKIPYLRRYLEYCLSQPKGAKLAIEVITKTRAITLLDEIILSLESDQHRQLMDDLSSLRSQLQQQLPDDPPDGPLRRGVQGSPALYGIQRQFVESCNRHLFSPNNLLKAAGNPDLTVFARSTHSWHALFNGQAIELKVSPQELEDKLKWIEFELLSPLASLANNENEIRTRTEELRELLCLNELWAPGSAFHLCPEDQLWKVPWPLLAPTQSEEPIFWLNPAAPGKITSFSLDATSEVAVWYSPSENLPAIESEVGSVLRRFPNARVCMTVDEVHDCLNGDFDWIHVACHSQFHPFNPLFSSFSLTDGRIFAYEIARSRLRTKGAVLSSCDSGLLGSFADLEPNGLTRSFLTRGAKAVIAAQWPLNDEVAGSMFEDFYNTIAGGANLIEGLASARRAGQARNSHPFFWGSLALFGGH